MTILSNRFGLVVVLSSLALAGCGGSAKDAKSPTAGGDSAGSGHAEVGKPAPDLAIQTLNGKGKITLESLHGKVVVVDFWATWCGPCKQSFPKLEELSKKVGDKVEIVGVSVDDDVKGVADFAKTNGATFAVGWDERHAIAERWGNISTMPTTFIVDATGKVRHIHAGYHDGETDVMAKEVAALVDERPSDTKMAKNDSKSDAKDSKSDTKDSASDSKSDVKDSKSDATGSASSSSSEEDKTEPPPPPPKKTGKGKKAAGKAAAPQKKPVKKK